MTNVRPPVTIPLDDALEAQILHQGAETHATLFPRRKGAGCIPIGGYSRRNPKDRPNDRLGASIALARALTLFHVAGSPRLYRILLNLPSDRKSPVNRELVLAELAQCCERRKG